MLYVRSFILALAAIFLSAFAPAHAATEKQGTSCECEVTACGPCLVETGVSFYSAKCGVDGSRVKSCKKPTCVPVENQKLCLSKMGEATPAVSAVSAPEEGHREPASKSVAVEPSVAGEVVQIRGAVEVERAGKSRQKLGEKMKVFVGDLIETKSDGMVKVLLKDGTDLIVAPNSKVEVELLKVDEAKKSRKAMISLLMGKVRSRVNKKFEAENEFKIKTRTAVAGVRGTDFVTSFKKTSDGMWISEVRTIEGMVRLDNAQRPAEPGFRIPPQKAADIPKGTFASLSVGPAPANMDDEKFFESSEFLAALESAKMSPVMMMKEEEIKALDEATEFAELTVKKADGSETGFTASSDEICRAPAGKFKQCSFTCEGGNPVGEKKCRTDLPGVSCVRRMCNGNGAWGEQQRLPSSASEECQAGAPQVRDCDSYSHW